MRVNNPILGVLSVVFPVVGFAAFALGTYHAERWSQMRVPFWSLLAGSAGGLLLAGFSLARRERFVAVPAIGFAASVAVGLYFVRLFL